MRILLFIFYFQTYNLLSVCFWINIKKEDGLLKEGENALQKPTANFEKEMNSEGAMEPKMNEEQMEELSTEHIPLLGNAKMENYAEEWDTTDEKQEEVPEKVPEERDECARADHPADRKNGIKSTGKTSATHLEELYQNQKQVNNTKRSSEGRAAQFLQANSGTMDEENSLLRVKRGVVKINESSSEGKKWPFVVPFSFDYTISSEMENKIYDAIQLWEDKICLFMVEDDKTSPRIRFTNKEDLGCRAYIGMQMSPERQEVDVEWPDCYQIGKLAHEIGHALGLDHEHQRYDRDSFVSYFHENVQSEDEHLFKKESTASHEDYGVPYDFGSVMHYGPKYSSSNGEPTLKPKAPDYYRNTIGQRYFPSIFDYMVLNKHYCGLQMLGDGYSINDTCSGAMFCHNNGFQNPKTCKVCICPPGFLGERCEKVDTGGYAPPGIKNVCEGATLFADSEWNELEGKVGTDALDSDMDFAQCHWLILADTGRTIVIQINFAGGRCSDGCLWGNTEIRTAPNRAETGLRLCCKADLGPNEMVEVKAENGYAMISLYSFLGTQEFDIRYRQY